MASYKNCPNCGTEFLVNYEGRISCSRECSSALRGSTLDRLFAKTEISASGCYLWGGYSGRGGYGIIKIDGRRRLVHHLGWELEKGDVPSKLFVLHHCDNPPCWKHEHLFLGTIKDNAEDMLRKGRANKARGEKHGNAKKTESEILQMISEYRAGDISQKDLAVKYGLHPIYVNKILTGKKWTHLHQG